MECSFNTLWIYTALKRVVLVFFDTSGFNTLWIYTALKPADFETTVYDVSIPSEFTLLSNIVLELL